MTRYDGQLLMAIRHIPSETEQIETHILRFPDRDKFDDYRADEEILNLTSERAACISHTEISFGVQIREII